METLVQAENMNQQLIELKLLDEATNIQYTLKVKKEVYNRAKNGKIAIINTTHYFIFTLLQKLKVITMITFLCILILLFLQI